MARCVKGIYIPLSFWINSTLSLLEKAVMIEMYSYSDDVKGAIIRVPTLASALNIEKKDVEFALSSLYKKGAFTIASDEDGKRYYKPDLFKKNYTEEDVNEMKVTENKEMNRYDYNEIAHKWAELNPNLPKITRWSPTRKNKLRASLKNSGLKLEDLYKVFEIISVTPFLNGETNRFQAQFDWLISKSEHISKIYEGFYSRTVTERKEYERILGVTEKESAEEKKTDTYK